MFRHASRAGLGSFARSSPLTRLFSEAHSADRLQSYHGFAPGLGSHWSAGRSPLRHPGHRRLTTLPSQQDTIYALSSAQGKAGIAVIRISGPACLEVYSGLCPEKAVPKPRFAGVRTLHHPRSLHGSDVLDSNALVLHFPAPRTVTGEDVLEFHVHGGPATVKAVLSAIPTCRTKSTVRYAEPGEFTKRAFLNDRLDLAQVESLGDILDAETDQQRRAAVRGSSGQLGKTYDSWRDDLLLARAEIEALIDFSEDQHFDESPTELLTNVTKMVQQMLHSIDLHELAGQRTELLRNGIRIALVGPPNAGKSSLMNLIIGREASIVSREAGTTRDVVEASLDIRGYLCTFADTAGFRSLANDGGVDSEIGAVEREGIRRARLKASESDVVIVLASVESTPAPSHRIQFDAETLQLAAQSGQCVILVNKCDTVSKAELDVLLADFTTNVLGKVRGLEGAQPHPISCREAEDPSLGLTDPGGIQSVVQILAASFEDLTSLPAEFQDLLGGTERQRQLLLQCRLYLESFMAEARQDHASHEPDIVVAAEYLRFAAGCLSRITGRGEAGDTEDVLGVIFEKFCVGK